MDCAIWSNVAFTRPRSAGSSRTGSLPSGGGPGVSQTCSTSADPSRRSLGRAIGLTILCPQGRVGALQLLHLHAQLVLAELQGRRRDDGRSHGSGGRLGIDHS
jgi:hypothetical protein